MVPESRPYRDTPTEQLEAEITALDREREQLRRQPRRFRADAHRGVDASVIAARARLDDLLWRAAYDVSLVGGDPITPTGIADVFLLATDPRVAELWHARIDAPPAAHNAAIFTDLDRPEYDRRMAQFAEAIAGRDREGRIRTLEADQARAAAELDKLQEVPA